jgi:hypothetical protein
VGVIRILSKLMPYHSVLLPQTGAFVCGCVPKARVSRPAAQKQSN